MIQKLLCMLGRHAWNVTWSDQSRVCVRCGCFQRYTLVDFGRYKVWMTFKRGGGR